jgi:HK97 family phage portal protein
MYLKLGPLEIGLRVKQNMVANMNRENIAVEVGPSSGKPNAMSMKNALQSNMNWAFACLDAISMRTSDMDYNLGFKTQVQGEQVIRPVEVHPFYDVWENPNTLFSSWQMQYLLYAHMNSAGVAFWFMSKNNAGRPEQVWPLEPHRMTKTIHGDTSVTYKYQTDKGTVEFDGEDILEFTRPNIFNIHSGFSPMMAAGVTIEIAELIDLYQWRLFKRGAWFPYAITVGKEIQQHEITKVRDYWMQRFRGGIDDHFIPPILNTDLNVVQGPSNLDLDLENLAEQQMEKVLGVFRTPKSKVGFSESLNKANALEIDTQWNREVIRPLLTQVSAVINSKWLPLYGNGDRLVGEYDNPVPQDEEFLLEEDSKLIEIGVLSRNEVREQRGFNPIDATEMEVPMVPFNMIPVGERTSEPMGEASITDVLTKRFWTDDRKDIFWKQFDDTIEEELLKWIPILIRLFNDQEKAVLESLDKEIKAVLDMINGWSNKAVQSGLDTGRIKGLEQIVPDPKDWTPIFAEEGGKVIADIYEVAGNNAVSLVGTGISFDISSPAAVAYIKDRALQYAKEVTETTAKKVRETLAQGFMEGETELELSQRIAHVFDIARDSRTNAIARTETGAAANSAALEGYKQAGLEKKFWMSARDGAVRETHLGLDEQYTESDPILINERFVSSSGATALHPHGFGVAEEDVNCRCIAPPIVITEEMFKHMAKYMEVRNV